MINNIHDHRLLNKLRKYLFAHPKYLVQLKSTAYCGSKIIRQPGMTPQVYLLKNNEDAKFYGMTSCKNSWFCPTCSVIQMSKYAANIAVALDALKQPKYSQWAFMATATIPHTSGMSCEESTEILYNTWKAFIVRGNHNLKRSISKNWRASDPFATFCESFNCKHRVRIGEFTYGKHGWHPHFHCLFWVDSKNFDLVKGWKDTLNERWLQLAKRETLKFWNKKFPTKKVENATRVEIMYSKMDVAGSKGFYISTDKNGNVIRQESSMYVCGWGADKEVTGNIQNKATHEGHYTPMQLLEQADETNNFMELYIEYALATKRKKHKRINWSARSGIHKIIAQWRITHVYQEVLKKKATAIQENKGLWEVIYTFNEQQWSLLCWLNTQNQILQKILELARASPQPVIDIERLLFENKIPLSKISPKKSDDCKHIQDLLNSVA